MIRYALRRTVSFALLCTLLLTGYGILSGQIVLPFSFEQTSQSELTFRLGKQSLCLNLEGIRSFGTELTKVAKAMVERIPAWCKTLFSNIADRATSLFYAIFGANEKETVPPHEIHAPNVTKTVFTNGSFCGRMIL